MPEKEAANPLPVIQEVVGELNATADGFHIHLHHPPEVLNYAIEVALIRDVLVAGVRAIDERAPDVTLTVANVEVELDDDEHTGDLRPGKHLGLTYRWGDGGHKPHLPTALRSLSDESKGYAYTTAEGANMSLTILLRDGGDG